MKISNFNTVDSCERGAWVTIKDFDEMDTDMEFLVVGVDSKVFKAQVNRIAKQNEVRKDKMDMDKLEKSTIRTLVAITKDWKNVEDDEGKEIKFSTETAEIIYTEAPYIAQQIIEFAKERQNFIEKK